MSLGYSFMFALFFFPWKCWHHSGFGYLQSPAWNSSGGEEKIKKMNPKDSTGFNVKSA